MAGVPNKSVGITITKPDGTTITVNETTDSLGQLVLEYIPDLEGSYGVAGSFAGDAYYKSSSASTNFSITNVGPTLPRLQIVGTSLYAGSSPIRINALNDTMIVAYDCYSRQGVGAQYKYGNMNFPNSGVNQHLSPAPTSNRQFLYEYFWLLKSLGLNGCRLGSSAGSEMSNLYNSWYIDHDYFVQYLTDMLDMAAANQVYIFFNFGNSFMRGTNGGATPGSFNTTTRKFVASGSVGALAGDALTRGTPAYNEYVAWMGAMMQQFEGHPALGAWDLANEPDGNAAYSQIVNGVDIAYWLPKYGTKAAAQQAFATWAQNLHDDVKPYTSHIVYIGTGGGEMFGWGEIPYGLRNAGSEIAGVHAYGSAQDDYLISTPQDWADRLGKPCVNTEVGWSSPSSPWCTGYWPWYDTRAAYFGVGVVWMQLNGCPYYNMPAHAGHPLTQAQMDAAVAAWIAFNGGP
jgi:hypothetical protein